MPGIKVKDSESFDEFIEDSKTNRQEFYCN